MQAHVTEIAPELFRISTFHPDFGIQFNQFLLRDEEPFLMHAGMHRMFEVTRDAVASLIDPAALRFVGFSHFEPDECGALNDWLRIAPRAEPVCSEAGALVMMSDFADRPARALADGAVLSIGRRELCFLRTPHLPHGWDAGLFFETTERTLLCSDLLFQPGDGPPLAEGDVVGPASDAMRAGVSGPLAHDLPYTPYTDAAFERLASLAPATLAIMHGSAYRGEGGAALRAIAEVVREVYGPMAGGGEAGAR